MNTFTPPVSGVTQPAPAPIGCPNRFCTLTCCWICEPLTNTLPTDERRTYWFCPPTITFCDTPRPLATLAGVQVMPLADPVQLRRVVAVCVSVMPGAMP